MEKLVPGPDSAETVTIRELCEGYRRMGYQTPGNANDAFPLLAAAAETDRFASVRVGAFVNNIDTEKQIQFSAVCFDLGDGSSYVAFRGTDNTIVGWKEDFNLTFMNETAGQRRAVEYVNYYFADTDERLILGGHSKGGNFAVYAGAFCDEYVQERIDAVYSNDGPGFRDEILEKNGWSLWEIEGEYKQMDFIPIYGRKAPFSVFDGIEINYVHELQHALRLCKIEEEIIV
jgi:hypothetical protein